MKTFAFIPLRGGSKSIPGKNIKLLAGKPLAYWAAKAASDCIAIDEVYIATDDDTIASTMQGLGVPKVTVIGRSAATATDTASTESALLEFAETVKCSQIVLIQATSPLLKANDLNCALIHFQENDYDSMLSAVKQKRFIWSEDKNGVATPTNYDPMQRPRRQDFDGYLVENGAFYVMNRVGLLTSKNRLYGKIGIWQMDPSTFVEIDEPDDWELVERVIHKRSGIAKTLLAASQGIKIVVTDVDGVLTDAGMYYSEDGGEVKKFNTRDGKGFELLRAAGIKTAIITSEDTKIVERRATKLKIDYVYQGAIEKLGSLSDLLCRSGCTLEQVAYIGDDLADLPVMERVGLSAAPSDASEKVKQVAAMILETPGGRGCFREFAEYILDARTFE